MCKSVPQIEAAFTRTSTSPCPTSGTGTLFTNSTDTWGNGNPSNAQTAGVDAAYGAQETWDFYKTTFGRNGIRNDGVGAYSRTHYGTGYYIYHQFVGGAKLSQPIRGWDGKTPPPADVLRLIERSGKDITDRPDAG